MNSTGWMQLVLVGVLVLVMPVWDRVETRRLRRATEPGARLGSYRRVVAILWVFSVLVVLVTPPARLLRPPAAALALVERVGGQGPLLGVLGGMVAGMLVSVVVALSSPEARARLARPLESLAWFLPSSTRERWWFAAMSVSAGICEELLYRGFLLRWLDARGLGLWAAVLLAALAFMLAHTYQGLVGMLSVGVLALVFTALFFLAGSLWPAMLVHALLDLRILVLWRGPPEPGAP
jgi:membrane protease YdiL (CAAX protease family)